MNFHSYLYIFDRSSIETISKYKDLIDRNADKHAEREASPRVYDSSIKEKGEKELCDIEAHQNDEINDIKSQVISIIHVCVIAE